MGAEEERNQNERASPQTDGRLPATDKADECPVKDVDRDL